jgi:gliding motility-associated-like protein
LNSDINGSTINDCGFTFFDSGGPTKDYYENENYTVTFCAPADQVLEIDFAMFSLGTGDVLNIFDGPTTASPTLAILTGNGPTSTLVSSTECVTFQIISDPTVVSEGWMINISCIDLDCQEFELEGSINNQDVNYISICPGESIELDVENITFPNNNTQYTQTVANTDFNLNFGNGTSSTTYPASSTYNTPGYYYPSITATDINNCPEQINYVVHIECPEVDISLSSSTHDIIDNVIQDVCLGDIIDLDISIENNSCYNQTLDNSEIIWSDGPTIDVNSFFENDFDTIVSENTITVIDEYGCFNTVFFDYKKKCQLIEVDLGSSSHEVINDTIYICPGDTVDFVNNVQYPENDICYHQADDIGNQNWEFNDDLPPTAPTHIYEYTEDFSSTDAIMPAIYQKYDQYGCWEDDTIIVVADCQKFEIDIISPTNTIIDNDIFDACINTDIEFGVDINLLENNNCYHQDINNFTVEWNTGNIGLNETMNYSESGTYTIEVKVSDQYGCYERDFVNFEVICQNIGLNIVSNTNIIDNNQIQEPCLGSYINLEVETDYPENDSCYHQSDNTTTFEWVMGDGNTYSSQTIDHAYISEGIKHISLVVTDQNGCSESANFFTVLTCQDFESTITSASHNINNNTIEACINTEIDVLANGNYLNNNNCYHQSDSNSIFLWEWLGSSANGNENTLIFNQIDTFPVFLTLEDTFGCAILEEIEVIIPCQDFNVSIESSFPIIEGVVYACPNENISFNAITDFYINESCYIQSNSTSTFIWTINNQTIESEQANYTFTESGITEVKLEVIDLHGCSQTFTIIVYIYVDPDFINTAANRDTICIGDTILLNGNVYSNVPFFEPDTIALPDNSFGVYESPLTFTVFPPDATLTDINDIESVCLDIEHSYPGDLEIRLYCPNGQYVELLGNPNLCDDNFLGEPVRSNNFPNIAGSPYTYCWSPNSTNGTMQESANIYTYSYTDNVGDSYVDHDYIPAGEYEVTGNFNDLLGCPMYGDWSIYIYDNLAQDNGYLFSWDLNINLNSFIENDTAIFPIDDREWISSPEGNIYYTDNNTAEALPLDTGNIDYTFTVVSKYGCPYDTSLAIYVAPKPVVTVEDNKVICNDLQTEVQGTVTGGTATWISSVPSSTNFEDPTLSVTNVIVDQYQEYTFKYSPNTISMCKNEDSVKVHFYQVSSDFTITDEIECYGDSLAIEFTGIASDSSNYFWNINNGSLIFENNDDYLFTFPNSGLNQVALHIQDWVCHSDTSLYEFNQPTPIVVSSMDIVDNYCYGYCEGHLSVETFGGSPPYSYAWYLEDNIISNSNEATNLCASNNYELIITDHNNCKTTATAQIGQPSPLTYSINITNPTCFGYSDGAIEVTNISGQNPPYTFSWSISSENTTQLNEVSAGDYQMYSIDQNNCTDTINIIVDEPEPVVLSLYGDTTVCKNTYVSFSSSITGGYITNEGYNVFWEESNMPITFPLFVDSEKSISVYATDHNNCISNKDYLTVHLFPKLQAHFNIEDPICEGNLLPIHIAAFGGTGTDYSYELDGILYNNTPIDIFPQSSKDININVNNICETIDTSFSITVNPKPQINTLIDNNSGCAPFEVKFSQNNVDPDNTYIYKSVSGQNYYQNAGIYSSCLYKESGLYTVKVMAKSKYNCVNTKVHRNFIQVYEPAIAKFKSSQYTNSILKPQVHFQNLSENNYYNYWHFGDQSISEEIDPIHNYSTPGQFNVELHIETEHGCTDSSSQNITIADHFSLYVPTAFTPNDDGDNDVFEVKGHGIDPTNFIIQIYDRWGEAIWSSNSLSSHWDGSVNGNLVKPDTYNWIIFCKDFTGTEYSRSGTVTLIR